MIENEYRVIWPDGSLHWILDIGKSYFNPAGKPVRQMGVSMDITAQKLFEEKLKENADLGELNRQLKGFAFTASHDLQAPLRTIKGFGLRLLKDYADQLDEVGKDYVARIYKAAVRMDEMLKGVLHYSQVDNQNGEEFKPVDLNQVIKDVLEELGNQIKQTGGRVQVSHLPTILADPLQMFQLFQNLIDNALKFARPGVPPLVKIYAQNQAGEENSPLAAAQPEVKIYVEDNGIGIDMNFADQLFQPFHRLVGRSQFEGAGLGLAICHKIVERHGGSITAQSKLQQDSIFIVTLPLGD
jgi:light-regulated signal transduction histidine kinase (bacteriophytochrome)